MKTPGKLGRGRPRESFSSDDEYDRYQDERWQQLKVLMARNRITEDARMIAEDDAHALREATDAELVAEHGAALTEWVTGAARRATPAPAGAVFAETTAVATPAVPAVQIADDRIPGTDLPRPAGVRPGLRMDQLCDDELRAVADAVLVQQIFAGHTARAAGARPAGGFWTGFADAG